MDNQNNKLAPVAIFVYNRLWNTKQTIEALQNNYLAKETDVFIFSDGAGSKKQECKVREMRQYLKTITGFKSITIIEREKNYYIEKNITDGVTEIINRYGKIIVLEDDGVSAKNFLNFMNDALDFYKNIEKIMHVASFTFIKMPDDDRKTIIWRYSENTGGGWATWKNRWDKFKWFKSENEALSLLSSEQINKIEMDGVFKCLGSLKANPIPWDICWYIAITINNGLAVNSPGALIKNNGLFNGTHFTILNKLFGKSPFEIELDTNENIILENNIIENKIAIDLLKAFYSKMGENSKGIKNRILNIIIRTLVILRITKLLKKILR
jgi:hypothetical protein